MRSLLLFTILVCFLALAWSAAVASQPEPETAAVETLLDVDTGVDENSDESVRQARQFFGVGYYGRPYYGGFGGYRRPYYGGYYGGYGRPYYGGYYGRPYYGGYGGFYG
ncbi:hypothetical protein FF38_11850 [Lucilia cuprina]|uniref:Neuropeptide-like protein 31 n=1 Tax=Lucilia cuprina TaxID=7375 RepID=A0A0L0BYF9_LUCCU|nr:hypothetical protein CVS40_0242 [Lucilia cuprina]KNC25055.1 hypothetical protein FF38_11850 [Lucilia cuprina]